MILILQRTLKTKERAGHPIQLYTDGDKQKRGEEKRPDVEQCGPTTEVRFPQPASAARKMCWIINLDVDFFVLHLHKTCGKPRRALVDAEK